ncbi:MAG: hypothetical protein J6A28_05040 [Clostridia bacterium]|nr:hypothetical protein [Clostridia bacterium]
MSSILEEFVAKSDRKLIDSIKKDISKIYSLDANTCCIYKPLLKNIVLNSDNSPEEKKKVIEFIQNQYPSLLAKMHDLGLEGLLIERFKSAFGTTDNGKPILVYYKFCYPNWATLKLSRSDSSGLKVKQFYLTDNDCVSPYFADYNSESEFPEEIVKNIYLDFMRKTFPEFREKQVTIQNFKEDETKEDSL